MICSKNWTGSTNKSNRAGWASSETSIREKGKVGPAVVSCVLFTRVLARKPHSLASSDFLAVLRSGTGWTSRDFSPVLFCGETGRVGRAAILYTLFLAGPDSDQETGRVLFLSCPRNRTVGRGLIWTTMFFCPRCDFSPVLLCGKRLRTQLELRGRRKTLQKTPASRQRRQRRRLATPARIACITCVARVCAAFGASLPPNQS